MLRTCVLPFGSVVLNGINGETYNVVDMGDTTHEKINQILSNIFGIQCIYFGNIFTETIIKSKGIEKIVKQINDKHMSVWFELCAKHCIQNTPIIPLLFPEMIQNNNLYLSGNKTQEFGLFLQNTKKLLNI